MLASELIYKLQELVLEHGNHPVVLDTDEEVTVEFDSDAFVVPT